MNDEDKSPRELELELARANFIYAVVNVDDPRKLDKAEELYRTASDEFYRDCLHH